jgi:hypothetical protein
MKAQGNKTVFHTVFADVFITYDINFTSQIEMIRRPHWIT